MADAKFEENAVSVLIKYPVSLYSCTHSIVCTATNTEGTITSFSQFGNVFMPLNFAPKKVVVLSCKASLNEA